MAKVKNMGMINAVGSVPSFMSAKPPKNIVPEGPPKMPQPKVTRGFMEAPKMKAPKMRMK